MRVSQKRELHASVNTITDVRRRALANIISFQYHRRKKTPCEIPTVMPFLFSPHPFFQILLYHNPDGLSLTECHAAHIFLRNTCCHRYIQHDIFDLPLLQEIIINATYTGIVKMHGGNIEAGNNSDGGIFFTIKIKKYLAAAVK